MDTENKENNTLLGVVVVVLVLLLLGLLSYLIFFLPKSGGEDVVDDTQDNKKEVVVDEDVTEEVVIDDTEEKTETAVVENTDATELEESEVQVTYMGEYPGAPALAYFKDAEGNEYLMDVMSSLGAEDVDREFVIKIESEEDITEGKKVTGEVYYFKVLTYKGDGEDISEDYADYIYFEVRNDDSTEVYFLKDYGLSLTVDKVYEFMFGSLEELDAAAGTSYWKMNGKFEYSGR